MAREKGNLKGMIPYALGQSSSGLSYLIVAQLTYCLTDSFGMSGAAVGAIMLFSRIFDGFSDIIAGIIIDKTHTKFGKARPYDLFMIPMWIFLVLCFNIPSFNTVGKIIWVFLMYNLCQTVCFTFTSVSVPIRLKRSFKESVRPRVLSTAALVSAVLSTIGGTLAPILIKTFEDRQGGWFIITGCFAVPAILMTLCMFFMVPEREEAEDTEEVTVKTKVTAKEAVKALISNKYIFLVALVMISASAMSAVLNSTGNFYYKYIKGDLNLMSMQTVFGLVGYIFLLLLPILIKKLGNRGTALFGGIMMCLGNAAKIIFEGNLAWIIGCATLANVGMVLITSVQSLLLIDCMSYGNKKNGTNYEGVYSSVGGVAAKVSQGLGAVVVGFVLDFGGFNSALEVQTPAALAAIRANFIWVPAVIALFAIIPMLFYNIKDKMLELEA